MFRVDEHSNGYFSISIVAMAKTSCYCYVFDPVNDVSGLDNERGEKVRVGLEDPASVHSFSKKIWLTNCCHVRSAVDKELFNSNQGRCHDVEFRT